MRKSLRKYPSATILYLLMVPSDLFTGIIAMPGYTIHQLNNKEWPLGKYILEVVLSGKCNNTLKRMPCINE